MKSLLILAMTVVACAQTTPPPTQPSGPPAPALPELPDQTVIATLDDGTKLTMADFRNIVAALPPQNQAAVMRDRKSFLTQWSLMRKLAKLGEQHKLHEQSPFKEAIEYQRLAILSQAELNDAFNKINIEPADIEKHYEANKEKYKSVHVKAIYVTFSTDAAKGTSEEQAKAKVAKLLSQIRSGADFSKLAKENSEDETSRSKDGDFATLRPTDNIPDAIRSAVFSLKQGETTEPVRQPNGFYLLKAEEVIYQPLDKLRDQIHEELRQQRSRQWLDNFNRENKVTFNSPEFIGEKPPAAPGR